MKLLRTFPLAAFALVILSIVSFCAATGAVAFLLITGAIAVSSWYVCEGPRRWALPRWAAHVLIVIASISVVPDISANPGDMIGALGRYTVWLSIIKLYERKSPNDYAQLLWLSLVLMVAGSLVTKELFFGAAVLLYSVLGMYVLLLYRLYAAYDAAQRERAVQAPPDMRLVPPLRPVLGRTVKGQFLGMTAGLGLAGLFVAAAIFLVVPRGYGAGIVKRLLDARDATETGYVDQVDLFSGVGRRITDSKTPVARVRLSSPSGEPIEYAGPLYLRGAVLERYDAEEHLWTATPERQANFVERRTGPIGFTALGDFTGAADTSPLENAYTFDFTPLSTLSGTLFTVNVPLALSTDHDRRVIFNRRTHILRLGEGQRAGSYRVEFDPNPSDQTIRTLNGGRRFEISPASIDATARVREEARRLLRDAGIEATPPRMFPERGRYNQRVARAMIDHFHRNFTYTLDLGGARIDLDPVESFLFDLRRGHCEFFAAAMTTMCHAVGVEARLVTGYLGAEYEGDGEYMIREANAHAWVEVRTGAYRWSTFDPTPPAAIEEYHRPERNLANRVRDVYEYFEVGWIENIVNFDDSAQADLQQTFQFDSMVWVNDAVVAVNEWLAQFIRRFGFAGTLQIVVVAAAIVVAVMIVVQLVRRARRIRRHLRLEHVKGREYRQLLRRLGFYLDMLDILKRGGAPKPVWQPPLAFAEAIASDRPEVVPLVRSLTRRFYAARYGGRSITAEETEQTRRLLHDLADALAVKR